MNQPPNSNELLDTLENLLESLHQQQVEKAAKIARLIHPGLTAEDLLNPDNFPDVMAHPLFTYEDGIAAGILSAKFALRSLLKNSG